MNDPEKDVRVISTPDVTGSSFQEQDRFNLDFDEVAGTFSTSSVASNRQLNETVGGMNLLTQGANQISEFQLRVFTETWTEPCLRQVVALETPLRDGPADPVDRGAQVEALRANGHANAP